MGWVPCTWNADSERTQKVYQKVQSSFSAPMSRTSTPLHLPVLLEYGEMAKGHWPGSSWAGRERFVYPAAQLPLRFREAVSLAGGHDTSGSTLPSAEKHPWLF